MTVIALVSLFFVGLLLGILLSIFVAHINDDIQDEKARERAMKNLNDGGIPFEVISTEKH